MKLSQQIADSFERYCLEYFQKDFSKHKNYLLKVAFGRNSSIISMKHFDEAILIYATDPNRGVRELYNVLQPVFNTY